MENPGTPGWNQLISDTSPDPEQRLHTIELIAALPQSSREVVLFLERLALKDDHEPVRLLAQQTLNAFPHQPVYRALTNKNKGERRIILQEMEQLEIDGVIGPNAAGLIKIRYALNAAARP